MKKIIFICIVIFIILGLPCLISYSLSRFNIHNEWIAFWGSYLGGFFTLIGVAYTIRYSKSDADEKQRLSIMPYLTINKDGTDDNEIIGLTYCLSEMQKEDRYIYFDELKIDGTGINIGMGPLVNCMISDIKVEKRLIDHHTNEASVVTNSGGIYFTLDFMSISLEKKDMTDKFLVSYSLYFDSECSHTPPYLTLEFYFYYEDVMGVKYRQKVEYHTQITNKDMNISQEVQMRFKKIFKPELI